LAAHIGNRNTSRCQEAFDIAEAQTESLRPHASAL
jgi:hypothetical protein